MPDTGAPWNIPYVASTDLVSDWPTDSLALANAIDSGLDAAGNAGIGSNVVQAVKTDIFSTTSTSFVDITGLTATITPSSATSKILLIAHVWLSPTSTVNHGGQLRFDGGNSGNYVGDTNVSEVRAWAGVRSASGSESAYYHGIPGIAVYVDSPATTSAVTYAVQARAMAGTLYVNRTAQTTTAEGVVTASSITAIEVAA